MPIEYAVHKNGDLVYAISEGIVTNKDILKLILDLSRDENINPQASQLFEVMPGSTMEGTHDSVLKEIRQKQGITKKEGHRCAVFAPFKDKIAWELADCYRVIFELYSPSSVVLLFADHKTAKRWLGISEGELSTN